MKVTSPDPLPAKKVYSPPRLVKYGEVRSLTQAGSMTNMETMAGYRNSDRRVKENILRVGRHPLGFGLYVFDFKAEYRDAYGHGRHFGVMADEVELVLPDAVCIGPAGHKMVNYARLAMRISNRQAA